MERSVNFCLTFRGFEWRSGQCISGSGCWKPSRLERMYSTYDDGWIHARGSTCGKGGAVIRVEQRETKKRVEGDRRARVYLHG